MTVTAETIASEAGLAAIEAEWRELWAGSFRPSPFLRYEWVAMGFRRLLREGRSVRLILVRDDGQLVLAAPLMQRPRYGVLHELAAISRGMPQHDDLLLRDAPGKHEWLLALLRTALRSPLALRLCLDRVPADRDTAITARRLRGKQSPFGECTIASMPDGFDAYFAGRSKSLRTDHRRQLRRMAERGEVTFRLADAASLDADMTWLLQQKRQWQPPTGQLRPWLSEPAAEADLREMCHQLLRSDGLCFGILSIGGEQAGASLCFDGQNETLCFMIAYDSALERYSPGRTAVILTLEAAARRGARLLDFMGLRSEWKDRLATGTVVTERIRLSRQ